MPCLYSVTATTLEELSEGHFERDGQRNKPSWPVIKLMSGLEPRLFMGAKHLFRTVLAGLENGITLVFVRASCVYETGS